MDTFTWIMVMCDADVAHLHKESFTLEDAINDYSVYLEDNE